MNVFFRKSLVIATALLCAALFPICANAAFPLQATQGTGSSPTSTTFSLSLPAFTNPVTSGNTVAVSYAFATGGGTLSTSVTDDKGNTYTIGQNLNDPFTGANLVTAYALNVTNGPKTITITAGGTTSGNILIGGATYEVPGPVTVDVNTTATQSSATAINIPLTTAAAGEYAVISAALSSGTTITSQNNGWTAEQTYGGLSSYQVYNTLASSGSNSWQATSSVAAHIAAAILTFAPSAGGCTHSFWSSTGTFAIPNGSSGSYWNVATGAFTTPNCSTGSYWLITGAAGST